VSNVFTLSPLLVWYYRFYSIAKNLNQCQPCLRSVFHSYNNSKVEPNLTTSISATSTPSFVWLLKVQKHRQGIDSDTNHAYWKLEHKVEQLPNTNFYSSVNSIWNHVYMYDTPIPLCLAQPTTYVPSCAKDTALSLRDQTQSRSSSVDTVCTLLF